MTSGFCSFSDTESRGVGSTMGASGAGEAMMAIRNDSAKVGAAQRARRNIKEARDRSAREGVDGAMGGGCDAMRFFGGGLGG